MFSTTTKVLIWKSVDQTSLRFPQRCHSKCLGYHESCSHVLGVFRPSAANISAAELILAHHVPPRLSSCVFLFLWSRRNLFEITRFFPLLSILLNKIIRFLELREKSAFSSHSLSLHPCTPIRHIGFSLKANIHRYLDRVMLFDILRLLLKLLSVKLSILCFKEALRVKTMPGIGHLFPPCQKLSFSFALFAAGSHGSRALAPTPPTDHH